MGSNQVWLGFVLMILSTTASKFDYSNYTVYTIVASNADQINYLHRISLSSHLDFWKSPSKTDLSASVMVSPTHRAAFLKDLIENNLVAKVMIDDVQQVINKEKVTRYTSRFIGDFDWNSYHTMSDIQLWLDQLKENYPNIISQIIGGYSHEGREIKGIKISYGANRKGIFIEGTIHAREWISAATVTYIINEILHSQDPETRKMAERYDWYIFPVTNPDGYIHSHEVERLWRKNRRQVGNEYGIDLNRNWNYRWGEFGTSFEPSSNSYGGHGPFSEEESRTLSEFITSIAPELQMYISFHSYSQLFLLPYGAPDTYADDHEDIMTIGRRAMGSLAVRYNTQYVTGTFADVLYPATGTSTDWVKAALGVPVVVMYELRDRGAYGFILPEDQIIPNCEEVMDSLRAIVREADALGYSGASTFDTSLVILLVCGLLNAFL